MGPAQGPQAPFNPRPSLISSSTVAIPAPLTTPEKRLSLFALEHATLEIAAQLVDPSQDCSPASIPGLFHQLITIRLLLYRPGPLCPLATPAPQALV
ncbi:hypothetical protein FRC09_019906 [Ceratobasidium sp. 395]|nr:hypothetical protein FRC09_019906 [Ceratobasidium sp. 395]